MVQRRKAVIAISGVIVIVILALVVIVKLNSNVNKNANKDTILTLGSMKYEVKNIVSKENLKIEESVAKQEYEVNNLEEQDGKLIIQTTSEIDNSDEAYKTAVFLKQSIGNLNKEKINSDGIKQIEVIIKGNKNSWLYVGDNSIKEININ